MYLLSETYAEGLGVARDEQTSRRYLLEAAEHGHALGAARVGNDYAAGSHHAEAAHWLRIAIDKATKEADFPAGRWRDLPGAPVRAWLAIISAMLLLNGEGVEKDVAQAVTLFHAASDHGCALATNHLARMSHQGSALPGTILSR